jgi:hypothetical protein
MMLFATGCDEIKVRVTPASSNNGENDSPFSRAVMTGLLRAGHKLGARE